MAGAVTPSLVFEQVGQVDAAMRADHVKRQAAVFENPYCKKRPRNAKNIGGSLGGEFVVFSDDGDGLPRFHIAGNFSKQRSDSRRDGHGFAALANEFAELFCTRRRKTRNWFASALRFAGGVVRDGN